VPSRSRREARTKSEELGNAGEAARQGPEGAPDAWLEIEPQFAEACGVSDRQLRVESK